MATEISFLSKGVEQFIGKEEFLKKWQSQKKLRVKFGIDPTAPDIHLGHTVVLEKLRQFQEAGHQAILIIGDFTATIGDPSGISQTRPPLTREEVLENAKTYLDQVFLILEKQKTEVVYNSEWFSKMNYAEILNLNSRITLQQVTQREDFKNRIAEGKEIRLHEIQYPLMQGWDSVKVKADVELGGTDQLFNLLVGRNLQEQEGQKPQAIMTLPLLEGLDGVRKMSKSYGNHISIQSTAEEMFAKIMSIPDSLLPKYALLLLGKEIDEEHPMEAKKKLAEQITQKFQNAVKAKIARETWENRVSKKELQNATLPILKISQETISVLELTQIGFMTVLGEKKSNSELKKKFIGTGAIQLNEKKLTDPQEEITLSGNEVLRLGKKYAVRIQFSK